MNQDRLKGRLTFMDFFNLNLEFDVLLLFFQLLYDQLITGNSLIYLKLVIIFLVLK